MRIGATDHLAAVTTPDYTDTSAGSDVCRGRLRRGRRAGAASRRRSIAGGLGRPPPVLPGVRSVGRADRACRPAPARSEV